MFLNRATAQEQKKQLRSFYLKKRSELTKLQVQEASAALVPHFLKEILPKMKTPGTDALAGSSCVVAAYRSLGNEISLDPLIESLERLGITICFPRTDGDQLKFHHASILTPAAWDQNPLGFLEPKADRPLCFAQIYLVPAIVYAKNGHRIGYGRGFYDRMFRRLLPSQVPLMKIGVGYDWQMAQETEVPLDLFSASDDVPMDKGLTPSGINSF